MASGKILIILHSETSSPGRVGHMLEERGYLLDIRRPCLGDSLPETLAEHEGAAIFGGPMSANDCDAFIRDETDWIAVPLKEKKPFLGICLGAQMLARHLGGKVGPHDEGLVEIGYYPLVPTDEGRKLGPWPATVYHWHREGFTLTQGCELLAQGETFANQAFRYDDVAYGLQFHPEVTRLMMHRWSVRGAHRFALKGAQHGAEHLSGQIQYDAPVRQWLTGFLDHWLKPSPAKQAMA
ncbi:glutamine amidotransferase [Taklimakanibacter lacteus]|uniref:glutamine amidotransferase n=1 Tax=Taklimakanibacter lacteus TaxID=2268456 RepID=UPI000E66BFC1